MAVPETSEVIDVSSKAAVELVQTLHSISYWLQAVGIVAILWSILYIVGWILNRKNHKRLIRVEETVNKIEENLDHHTKEMANRFDDLDSKLDKIDKKK